MRIVVCGSRLSRAFKPVAAVLDSTHETTPIDLLIQGGSTGVDANAACWAQRRKVPCLEVVANWGVYGRAAGPIRNQQMADMRPDLVIAFPGGTGTADMVRRAEAAGIPVQKIL